MQRRSGRRVTTTGSDEIERLTREARAGNRAALTDLLMADLPGLTQFVHGRVPAMVRGHLDTIELSHEVFFLAFKALSRFRIEHTGSVPGFTRRIATNRLYTEYRNSRKRPQRVELDSEIAAAGPGPEQQLLASERASTCRAVLSQLRTKDQQLLKARHCEGLDLASIARGLGMPTAAAAGVAVKRAEARFRRIVDGSAPGGHLALPRDRRTRRTRAA